jgi:hypothetical protein
MNHLSIMNMNDREMKDRPSHEVVYCLDSINAIRGPEIQNDPINNPTNDVTLKVQMSTDKVQFKSIELATLEMPAAQLLIEDQWSKFHYMNNVPMFYDSVVSRSFTIVDATGFGVADVVLPVHQNRITDIDDSNVTDPIFYTGQPHNLKSFVDNEWYVTSTSVGTFPINSLTLTIIDDTSFSVSGFPTSTLWKPNAAATRFGYLVAPHITDYKHLAYTIDQQLPNEISLSYDDLDGRFALRQSPNSQLLLYLSVIHDSLAKYIGFATGRHKISAMKNRTLYSRISSDTLGLATLQLDSGNYFTEAALLEQLTKQTERFYFTHTQVHKLSIMDSVQGTVYTINIPSGNYTPESFAQTITSKLSATPVAVEVEFSSFSSSSSSSSSSSFEFFYNKPFTLLFDPIETSPSVSYALGFQETVYSGEDHYVSNLHFSCQPISGTDTFPTTIIDFDLSTTSNSKLVLTSSTQMPKQGNATINSSTITVLTTEATNYQVGDLVHLTDTTGSVQFDTSVLEVKDAQTFVLDLCALVPGFAPSTSVVLSNPPMLKGHNMSLMLAPREQNVKIASILGFRAKDNITNINSTITANYSLDLIGSDYIMMQIIHPIGSSRTEQLNETNNNHSNFIGKVVLINTTIRRVSNFVPMKFTFSPRKKITQIQVRFLTPRGDLYQLHGRNWSATLICKT